MKQNDKRQKLTVRAARERAHRMVSLSHILIAVVALLECFVLLTFTTYSWIESSSSLTIMNGPKTTATTSTDIVNMDIVEQRKYRTILTEDTVEDADLNDFYSKVTFFNLAKASSPDGIHFYFPKENDANSGKSLTSFREGDTTDYNTGYLYFDFDIYNNLTKYDFFFNNLNIFSAQNTELSKDSSGNNYFDTDDLAAIRKAMRISVQQNADTPMIFAETNTGYQPANGRNSCTAGNITPNTIAYSTTTSQGGTNHKIFTSTIQSTGNTKVSIRIWFECRDAGFMTRYATWSALKKKALSGVQLGIDLRLINSANTFSDLLFDDYTFSTNADNPGGHITDDYYLAEDYEDYRMFFVYKDSSSATHYSKMHRVEENANAVATRWATMSEDGVSETNMQNLKTGSASTNYTKAYFAFGKFPESASTPTSTLYKWTLTSAPSAENGSYLYDAISAVRYSSATNYIPECLGGWYDYLLNDGTHSVPSGSAPITLVKFKDIATGYTNSAYNSGDNFRYITAAATASSALHDVVYVNVQSSFSSTNAQAALTSSLFYNAHDDVFMGYVPTVWLTDSSNYNMYFRYCPGGYYASVNRTWESTVATHQSGDYIYTALGYSDANLITTASATNAYTGQGTWLPVDSTPVKFSTELIDSNVTSGQRFKVFANIAGNSYTYLQYAMLPDSSHTVFYAYVPTINTPARADLKFCRYSDWSNGTPNAYWYADVRCSDTYYPVEINSTSNDTVNNDARYTRGYWNVSVLVDATWEHLIYDTITNATTTYSTITNQVNNSGGTSAYGTLEYSFDGETYSNLNTSPYALDGYRWYVPGTDSGASRTIIYYRWRPYTGTEFIFEHYLADGIYCVITEADAS